VHVLLSTPGAGIAILGSGGIGKTEVATAVLYHHRVQEAYGAFRFFVRCDGATASSQGATASYRPLGAVGQLVSLMATQLGLDVSGGHPDLMDEPRGRADEKVVSFFSRQSTVLVLDNFETVWDGSEPDLDEFIQRLRALQNMRLIVTMRGNVTPGVKWLAKPLDTLDAESAKEIFIVYSGKEEFRSDPFLEKLLAAVDRLPLAIVLLAKQARLKPNLRSLQREWRRRRTAMLRDPRYQGGADPARMLSLEASIQLSLDRPMMASNPPALTLLSLLSLLPDGASWEDLEALVPSSTMSLEYDRPEEVLLRLALAYTASSRAGQLPMTGTSCGDSSEWNDIRLHVLVPIREYIQRVYAPGEADYRRLRRHYLSIAITAETEMSRLRPDIHNLEFVTVRAISIEAEQELAMCAASVLWGVTLSPPATVGTGGQIGVSCVHHHRVRFYQEPTANLSQTLDHGGIEKGETVGRRRMRQVQPTV
jgi:hypothetical protein